MANALHATTRKQKVGRKRGRGEIRRKEWCTRVAARNSYAHIRTYTPSTTYRCDKNKKVHMIGYVCTSSDLCGLMEVRVRQGNGESCENDQTRATQAI